jgi:hypothetical protein
MFKLIGQPRTVRVTSRIAHEFAVMAPPPRERPRSELRIMVYSRAVNAGTFRPVTWARAYCKENGETCRVNGQHTSEVFEGLCEKPGIQPLYAIIEQYECETLDDVSRLYSTFDSKMQSRSTGDINRSFAACVAALSDLPERPIGLAVSGIAYAEHQDAYTRATQPAERAEKLLEFPDFVVWLHQVGFGGSGRTDTNAHLKRMAVAAAMFATYQKHKRLATEFWTAVREETGTTPDCGDRKLARFLLTHGLRAIRHQRTRYRVKDREFYSKSLLAWNAWRKGASTNLSYHAKAPVPQPL